MKKIIPLIIIPYFIFADMCEIYIDVTTEINNKVKYYFDNGDTLQGCIQLSMLEDATISKKTYCTSFQNIDSQLESIRKIKQVYCRATCKFNQAAKPISSKLNFLTF